MVTGNEDDALLLALFDIRIAGFVPKTSSSAIIEAAIHLVLAGGRYLPRALLNSLLHGTSHRAERPPTMSQRRISRA